MSLFRTLQNSPAIISVFHNGENASSARVYSVLEKAYNRLNNEKNQFQIDLVTKQMPTYDQYKDIYTNCGNNANTKRVLETVFPLLKDTLQATAGKFVTTKSIGTSTSGGLKVFSPNEYEHIHSAFLELVSQSKPDVLPSKLFTAPLVVDWDQNLIAADEEGLEAILAKYEDQPAADLSVA